MSNEMFCFQCEQTAGCSGCTRSGVCGKSPVVAHEQDELTGALIGLARIEGAKTPENTQLILDGLFTTITNVDFDPVSVNRKLAAVRAAKEATAKAKGAAVPEDYDMNKVWNADEDIRSLKSLILFGIRGMAAYAYHAAVTGYHDEDVDAFFYKALEAIGHDDYGMDQLLPLVLETGSVNLKCMALLDKANTETFGTPEPTPVSFKVEKGPFIVVTGHDLEDLKLLLEQTKDKGVNVYTHGEMLPAHAYPELKKYPQLKGNFGTAWQNQQKEFADLPGAILYTTNCLMPLKSSYADRVFTTEMVEFPEAVHIDEKKDFTPVIEKALELGGYDEDKQFTGINGGTGTMVGFGHGTVISVADKVVEAVKKGDIKHFFLVGGCDGARVGRN